jgi:hypothetical protein
MAILRNTRYCISIILAQRKVLIRPYIGVDFRPFHSKRTISIIIIYKMAHNESKMIIFTLDYTAFLRVPVITAPARSLGAQRGHEAGNGNFMPKWPFRPEGAT